MPRFAIVKIFHILNIKKSIFLNIDFFMSLLFVAIYEYIGEGEGGLAVGNLPGRCYEKIKSLYSNV